MRFQNKWLRFLVLLPIPLIVAGINYVVDPSALYHDNTEAMARSMAAGNKTWFAHSNVNEREVKRHLIEAMPREVDCIAVGPSLIMGVRSDTVGTQSFYNLSESGADFYDILAQFALLDLHEITYHRVIFCVDSYFFDEKLYRTLTRSQGLKPYAQYMIDTLEQKDPIRPHGPANSWKEPVKSLLSPSYFQASIADLKKEGGHSLIGARWGIVNENYEGIYYMPDGSIVYAVEAQNRTGDYVTKDAENYNIEYQFSKGGHIDPHSKEIFEKLIQYLLKKNISIELFLCPVAPSLWERINSDDYPSIPELEMFAHEMAQEYNLRITGTYNPYCLRMSDEDFYDARHVRHDLLTKYFDFRPYK